MDTMTSELLVPRTQWMADVSKDAMDDSSVVHVVSFNTLRRNYRFNGNTYTKDEHRDPANRLALVTSILGKELAGCDFMALQEVEEMEDFAFLNGAYDVVLPKKGKAGQHDFTKPRLFFLRDKWELQWSECRSRITLAGFKRRGTSQIVCVWDCHLQGGPKGAEDRSNQIKSAATHMKKHTGGLSVPIIIAGDMNASAGEVDFSEAGLVMSNAMQKCGVSFPTHLWGVGPEQFRSTLDSIYTSPHFSLQDLRNPLTEEQWELVRQVGMPNAFNPSDHLPMAGRFRFRSAEEV